MNKRIKRKKLKAKIIAERSGNVIIVEREAWTLA